MSPAIGDGYANGNMGPLAVTSIKPALIMYSAAVQLKVRGEVCVLPTSSACIWCTLEPERLQCIPDT